MKVAVIGTGLIGASVGLAARRAGHDVRGWDTNSNALSTAGAVGAVDPADSADDAAASAELVVVAVQVT
ncbi:MAG: NAD(P)-binding domain-containing protein, partial [Gaiellaceae bacterium]